jgi:hypothetical protein
MCATEHVHTRIIAESAADSLRNRSNRGVVGGSSVVTTSDPKASRKITDGNVGIDFVFGRWQLDVLLVCFNPINKEIELHPICMIAKEKRGKAGGKLVLVVGWTNRRWRTIRRHPGAVANVESKRRRKRRQWA